MKVVKTSAIALAISAMVAGPVLAQGVSPDTKMRGGAQGKSQMQGGASGTDDEELSAQPGTGTTRAGANAKTKGTVGAGGATSKTNGGADSATGSKRQ